MSATTVQGFTHGFPDNIKSNTSTFGQSIIDELCITRMLLPKLHTALVTELRSIYTYNVEALQCQFSVIRFAAARCFAGMCKADPSSGMRFMIESVLPMVADQHQLRRRQGAIECIYRMSCLSKVITVDLVTTLDSEILPYVIFLIVPVMGRMSDSNTDVRLLATETFATLVKLVPLEVLVCIYTLLIHRRESLIPLTCLRRYLLKELRKENLSLSYLTAVRWMLLRSRLQSRQIYEDINRKA